MKHVLRFLLLVLMVALSFTLALSSAALAQEKDHQTAKSLLDSCIYIEPDTVYIYADYCELNSYPLMDSGLFYIHDCGDTGLFWTVTPDQPWVSLYPESGYDSSPVQVRLDWLALSEIVTPPEPGDTLYYSSIVTIEFPNTIQNHLETVVMVRVFCSSDLGYDLLVDPHMIEYTLPPDEIRDGWIYLEEVQGREMKVYRYYDENWLSLPAESNPIYTPDSIMYTINTAGLYPGYYADTIAFYAFADTFSQNDDTASQLIDKEHMLIVLQVEDQSDLVVNPESFEFSLKSGYYATDTMYIASKSGDTLLLNFSNSSSWLNLPVFFTAPTTPTNLWFNINTTGLAPGRYYDEIQIVAYTMDNEYADEISVPVRMEVLPDSSYTIATDRDFLRFETYQQLSVYDSIYVYEVSGASIPYYFNESAPWMIIGPSVANPQYMTPEFLYVLVNITNLPPGYYSDTLEIFSVGSYTGDTTMKRIPVDVIVNQFDTTVAHVQALPEWYDFTLKTGGHLSGIPVMIFEERGLELEYNVEIKKGDWLRWSHMLTVIPVMPDSAMFEIDASGLAPGVYYDTAVIYKPTDDLPTYEDQFVTFRLTVLEDTTIYDVDLITEPNEFTVELNMGEVASDSLFIYESNGFPVPFIFNNKQGWLTVEPFGMGPYITPTSLMLSVFADDSLLPGMYYDTITIYPYPASDTMFAPTYVPVKMIIRGDYPLSHDSLLVSSVVIDNCYSECYKLSVFTQLMQEIKGANIPFEIPDGVSICSLSTSGLYTENWDKTVMIFDANEGYFQTALVNTSGYTIPPGLTNVFDVYFTVDDCSDGQTILWDTTFSTIPSRSLAFVDSTYNLIYPGYSKYRNPTIVATCVPGDFDGDGYADISDVVDLVDFMFTLKLSGYRVYPSNPRAMDLNNDCIGPDIADLVYMVDYMFRVDGLPWECGCIGDVIYPKKVNSNFIISTEFKDGQTIVSINSPSDIRGIDLLLSGYEGHELVNLTGQTFDLVEGHNLEQLAVGLLDLDGNNVIASGKTEILRTEGNLFIEQAVIADDNYSTIYPHIGKGSTLPNGFELSQNYPNPFNPSTEIKFSLPEPGHVLLEIFNIKGQLVTTLADDQFDNGWHTIEWNSRDNNGQSVASGIYLYRLESNGHSQSKKMILLK